MRKRLEGCGVEVRARCEIGKNKPAEKKPPGESAQAGGNGARRTIVALHTTFWHQAGKIGPTQPNSVNCRRIY